MARVWTCRKCGVQNARIKQLCVCGQRRPAPRRPKHQMVLEFPYEMWVARFGELCGICGRPPSERRRLDRDHDHRTGVPRGLLCARCNQALPNWVTVEWLLAAIRYLTNPVQNFDDVSSGHVSEGET